MLETPVADEEYAGWIFEKSNAIAVAIDSTPLVLVRRDRLRIQLEATPIYAIIIVLKMGVESLIGGELIAMGWLAVPRTRFLGEGALSETRFLGGMRATSRRGIQRKMCNTKSI